MKGIWFDDLHSYDDMGLILSKVDIPPAIPKTQFIDIPSGDGSVDLTEALGEVRYNNREATITFTVLPQDDFEQKKTEVSNLLNGMRFERIVVDKDPLYFWTGRCVVNEYASNKRINQIVVKAILAPYKRKVLDTAVEVSAGENVPVVLKNGKKKVIPTIITTADATIVFGDTSREIPAGTHTVSGIVLKFGNNDLTVTSEGVVTFVYKEGDL